MKPIVGDIQNLFIRLRSERIRVLVTLINAESNMINEIVVVPLPCFVPEHSDVGRAHYVFAYTITIENRGDSPAQLISRHWIITDERQRVQEVRGLGVVGEQPVLQPGEKYRYTSGCTIGSPLGTMKGSYQFINGAGDQFSVAIPEFVLAVPSKLH